MRLADFKVPDRLEPMEWLLPLEHLSATSLNMLQRCPRQFQERYVFQKLERPGAARVLGSAFHKAQEHNWVQKITSYEDVPTDQVVEFFHDAAWPGAVEAAGGQAEIEWDGEPERTRETGARMVRAYRDTTSPRVQPLAVEERFEHSLAGLPVPLLGFVDVRTDTVMIDEKTSKQKKTWLKPDWRLQARIYQLFQPLHVDFHVITKAAEPTVWTPLDSPQLSELWNKDQVFETQAYVRQLAQLANHYMATYGDDPWPTTGIGHDWACDWCGFRSNCPAWKSERVLAA